MKMKRVIIKVEGYVQGVFFRYTTRKFARKLGLVGFVKNLQDGSVLIDAEGSQEELDELIKFAKVGPKYAVVDKINIEYKDPTNKYKGFDYQF